MHKRLNVEYKSGVSKKGRKYKIPYTYDYGFAMAIECNGNMNVQRDASGALCVIYDPHYAQFCINDAGYPVLRIADEDTVKGNQK